MRGGMGLRTDLLQKLRSVRLAGLAALQLSLLLAGLFLQLLFTHSPCERLFLQHLLPPLPGLIPNLSRHGHLPRLFHSLDSLLPLLQVPSLLLLQLLLLAHSALLVLPLLSLELVPDTGLVLGEQLLLLLEALPTLPLALLLLLLEDLPLRLGHALVVLGLLLALLRLTSPGLLRLLGQAQDGIPLSLTPQFLTQLRLALRLLGGSNDLLPLP
mmetsp:Transcript_105658/g.305733  ORF Transcript_105658/g.305733 Transcript_105658/m.305733 type:complete len:213 (-) Transcript_105658:421-1059(-)